MLLGSGRAWGSEPPLPQTLTHTPLHTHTHTPTHPQPLYNRLLTGLTSPDTAPSAARAIRDVCLACGALMGEPALGLYDQLLAARCVMCDGLTTDAFEWMVTSCWQLGMECV